MLLHARLLLHMLRLHALRLLSMALLRLLPLRSARLTLLHLAIFLFLLLLHLLMLCVLFRSQLFLLLLVFLILLRVAGVRRRVLVRLHLARVVVCSLPGLVCRTVTLISARRICRRRMILAARFACRYRAVVKVTRSLRRRDRRPALIGCRAQLWIAPRRFSMLLLGRHWSHVPLARVPFLLRRWAIVEATLAAVVRDAGTIFLNDRRPIRVVNDRLVHMHDRGVVEEVIILPTSAFKSISEVSKSIVNSAVETDVRSPISAVPEKCAAAPAPPARRPQKSWLRRQHPRSRHPVIPVNVVVRPITRRPQISISRANRLFINRNCGRTETYRNDNLSERGLREHQ